MPLFRIHRLRDHLKQSFRNAPHVSGTVNIKPRDYVPGDSVSASSPYALYFDLRNSGAPLDPGDVLESETGGLRIFKFVGFEEALWVLPELKPDGAKPEGTTSDGSSASAEDSANAVATPAGVQ